MYPEEISEMKRQDSDSNKNVHCRYRDYEQPTQNIKLFRRLLHDDGYGVGEPLNETETFNGEETGLVVVGEHRLLTGHTLDQV